MRKGKVRTVKQQNRVDPQEVIPREENLLTKTIITVRSIIRAEPHPVAIAKLSKFFKCDKRLKAIVILLA